MLELIAQLVLGLAAAFISLMTGLFGVFFEAGWIGAHNKGIRRFFYFLIAFAALHLFVGMALAVTGSGEAAILSLIFGTWEMLASFCVLVFGIVAVLAVEQMTEPEGAPDREGAQTTVVTHLASQILAFAIVMGALSIWATQSERRSLTDRLCDSAEARISQELKDKSAAALDFAERLSKRDLRAKLLCLKEPKE